MISWKQLWNPLVSFLPHSSEHGNMQRTHCNTLYGVFATNVNFLFKTSILINIFHVFDIRSLQAFNIWKRVSVLSIKHVLLWKNDACMFSKKASCCCFVKNIVWNTYDIANFWMCNERQKHKSSSRSAHTIAKSFLFVMTYAKQTPVLASAGLN